MHVWVQLVDNRWDVVPLLRDTTLIFKLAKHISECASPVYGEAKYT